MRLYRIGNAWESVIGVMVLIRKQSSSKPDKQVSANWKPDVGDDVLTQTTAWKKNTINRNRKEVEDWLIGEWGGTKWQHSTPLQDSQPKILLRNTSKEQEIYWKTA